MPYFHMKLLVPNSHFKCAPSIPSRLLFSCLVDDEYLLPTFVQFNQISLKSTSRMFAIPNSFLRVHFDGALQTSVKAGDSSKFAQCIQPKENAGFLLDQIVGKEFQIDNSTEHSERPDMDNKEIERRRKISQANKGKRPWNKGIKHSAETRKLIKQRTIEALRDPKIRKKMSECPRSHSEESKAKIGMAQKRVWRMHIKRMRLKEKVYMTWADSIAEAAKRGACDQEELNWDSYENMKAEHSLQQLRLAADEAEAKEAARLRAAKEKAERMAMRAKNREERELKANEIKSLKRRSRRKLKEETEESVIRKGLSLKATMPKARIRWTKQMDGETACQGDTTNVHQPATEKLDLDFIRREKLRREVSLADQIQAAKKKREKSAAKEALAISSSNFLLNESVASHYTQL